MTTKRQVQALGLLLFGVLAVTAKGSADVFTAEAAGDCTAHPDGFGDHGAPEKDE